MTKAIGWIVSAAFGVLIGTGLIYAVGETVDHFTAFQ